jgi:YHS domain-containing protein
MRLRIVVPRVLLAMAAALSLALSAYAVDPVYTRDGLGLSGYDAVAYFSEGKPVKGSQQFEHQWDGVRWRFASAAHRDAFAAAPEKYAPQYGGYCAYAVSKNTTYASDPEAWKVVDGKLYLNANKDVKALWEKELPDVIQRADRNWPGAREQPPAR